MTAEPSVTRLMTAVISKALNKSGVGTMTFSRVKALTSRSRVFLKALGMLISAFITASANGQTYDLTMDVLVNSSNPTGYSTATGSPGEYQRYIERYLEHLQIPYRVIDTSTQGPPANLGSVQLIVAAHTGLSLSASWQQAILEAARSARR